MIVSAHQPQYMPWLGYFDKIARSDCFVVLDQVQYKIRDFQNRNKIRTAEGWGWLTVPVKTKNKYKQSIRDAQIDNSIPWAKEHLAAFETWYRKAPFFDYYYQFLDDLYSHQWDMLKDLNISIIEFSLKHLGIDKPLYFESDLGINSTRSEKIIDICRSLNADTYLASIGAKSYLEEDKFKQAGISLVYHYFEHPVYSQLYTGSFVENLSIFDLFLNEGKAASEILALSRQRVYEYGAALI